MKIYIIFGLIIGVSLFLIPSVFAYQTSIINTEIKTDATLWSEGKISDTEYATSILSMYKEGYISIPDESFSYQTNIPEWFLDTTKWWSKGKISDTEYIKALQYNLDICNTEFGPVEQITLNLPEPKITVQTDKGLYTEEETVKITGTINKPIGLTTTENAYVKITMTAETEFGEHALHLPDNGIVALEKNAYSFEVRPAGFQGAVFPGKHTVLVKSDDLYASTNFYITLANTPPLGEGNYKVGYKTGIIEDIEIYDWDVNRHINPGYVIYYPAITQGENTPIVDKKFPVIVYSQASSHTYFTCSCNEIPQSQHFKQMEKVLSHMASWGFIIISSTQFGVPSDRVEQIEAEYQFITEENQNNNSFLHNKIDTDYILGMGMSNGGGGMFLAQKNLDFKGIILLAPNNESSNDVTETNVSIPLILIGGTNDALLREIAWGAGADYFERGWGSFYDAGTNDKYIVKILGANHFGFTDSLCFFRTLDEYPAISRTQQQDIAKAYATAFALHYTKDQETISDKLSSYSKENIDEFLRGGALPALGQDNDLTQVAYERNN